MAEANKASTKGGKSRQMERKAGKGRKEARIIEEERGRRWE